MFAKTAAAFLAGALAASSGTAVALTKGPHSRSTLRCNPNCPKIIRLKEGERARYGMVVCQAMNTAPIRSMLCVGAGRYEVFYGPSDVSVYRSHRRVFDANPGR
jgi:hypothetical protein